MVAQAGCTQQLRQCDKLALQSVRTIAFARGPRLLLQAGLARRVKSDGWVPGRRRTARWWAARRLPWPSTAAPSRRPRPRGRPPRTARAAPPPGRRRGRRPPGGTCCPRACAPRPRPRSPRPLPRPVRLAPTERLFDSATAQYALHRAALSSTALHRVLPRSAADSWCAGRATGSTAAVCVPSPMPHPAGPVRGAQGSGAHGRAPPGRCRAAPHAHR
jgi:hypothetical protein